MGTVSYRGHTPASWPVPTTAFSFAPDRVPEHPDFAIGSYISEPFLGVGQEERSAAMGVGTAAVLLVSAVALAAWYLPRLGDDLTSPRKI